MEKSYPGTSFCSSIGVHKDRDDDVRCHFWQTMSIRKPANKKSKADGSGTAILLTL
jgi:hypothetical protein